MYFILIFRERSIINRIILVFRWDVTERIFLVNYLQKTHQGFFFASITLCFFINIPWNCLNSLCISWIHLGMSLPFHRNSDFTNPNESQALVFLKEPPPPPPQLIPIYSHTRKTVLELVMSLDLNRNPFYMI